MPTLKSLYPELNDDGKLYQRFLNKRTNAAKEGITFALSYVEFAELIRAAGIVSSSCGIKGYHLAREGDTGDYVIGNCSFKHYLDNLHEKRVTDRARCASRVNIKHLNLQAELRTPDELASHSVKIRMGIAASDSYKERKAQATQRRVDFDRTAHKSYLGDRNSQAGTFWITDDIVNKKWHDSKGDLPPLFHRGRVVKF